MEHVDLNNQGAAHSSAPTKTNGGRPDRRSLERLLRAASRADVLPAVLPARNASHSDAGGRPAMQAGDQAPEMPFGFDTRVVANSRAPGLTNGNGLSRLVRRVALAAAAIIVAASAGAVREFAQARELSEPITNEYALADSAIQIELSR